MNDKTDYFAKIDSEEKVDSDYEINACSIKRNIQDPEEWDFRRYIEDPKDPKKFQIAIPEGIAALEYELTRELFFTNRNKDKILEKIKNDLNSYHATFDNFDRSERDLIECMLKKEQGSIFISKFYHDMHSYIRKNYFPNTPWFKLSTTDRHLYTLEYVQTKAKTIPSKYAATIDLRWSAKDLSCHLDIYKVLARISSDTKARRESADGDIEAFDIKKSKGGRGKGHFKDDLCQLGRLRLINHFGSPDKATTFWESKKGSSGNMDKRCPFRYPDFTSQEGTNWLITSSGF